MRCIMNKQLLKSYRLKADSLFIIYWNDYLTVSRFAEDYDLTEHQANRLIKLGRAKHNKMANQFKSWGEAIL